MNHQVIEGMQKDQRIDDLDHKVEVYDGVKATLKLCETMIQALDATTDNEKRSQRLLVGGLGIAKSWAILGATDCEIEKSGLTK